MVFLLYGQTWPFWATNIVQLNNDFMVHTEPPNITYRKIKIRLLHPRFDPRRVWPTYGHASNRATSQGALLSLISFFITPTSKLHTVADCER